MNWERERTATTCDWPKCEEETAKQRAEPAAFDVTVEQEAI